MSDVAPPAAQARPILEMSGIGKTFGGVTALTGVDFALMRGEVHGLIGENGAGKSTLMKTLAGVHAPTEGTIRIDGEEVHFAHPAQAQHAGIGIVYQELSLLTNLSVAHNISLGSEPTSGLAVDERRLAETAARVLARMGVSSIDPAQKVGKLPLAERQLVEIAKVLTLRQPRVLIFDEPTRGIDVGAKEEIYKLLNQLADDGKAVIMISSELPEVLRLSHRIVVMSQGRVTGTLSTEQADQESIMKLATQNIEEVAA